MTYNGSGRTFTDSTFSGTHALYWSEQIDHKMFGTYQHVNAWTRPKDINDGSAPSLWGTNGVLPNGVRQGHLGDCWFLASPSALAEYP